MKRNLIAVLVLFSFMLVLVHDIIPHHHHEMENFMAFSHEDQHGESDQGIGTEHHDQNIPFPNHQHFSATEDFDVIQKNTNLIRFLCSINSIDIKPFKDLHNIYKPDPPGILKYPEFSANILSPVSISPNTLRGSPVIA